MCVMFSGCHWLLKKKCCGISSVCALLCNYVRRKPIFVDIWPLVIIPQSTNKSQTHILSCLSCAASLLQCVMSKTFYQLFKGQMRGCFLWEDTWCSSPAIIEPTITSLTCPSLIGLEQPLTRIRSVSQGCCHKSEQDSAGQQKPSHHTSDLTDIWTSLTVMLWKNVSSSEKGHWFRLLYWTVVRISWQVTSCSCSNDGEVASMTMPMCHCVCAHWWGGKWECRSRALSHISHRIPHYF